MCAPKKSKSKFFVLFPVSIVFLLILLALSITCVGESIYFAGESWTVRTWSGNPGNNIWAADNVYKDSQDRLHLRIDRGASGWTCAQVSKKVSSYGKYRFYVIGRVDRLPQNVVFGLFLYQNDTHELDIEFANKNSGVVVGFSNAQYVVQSRDAHPFNINLNGTWSTHYIDWQSDHVTFKSMHGHHKEPDWSTHIQEWTYRGSNIPQGEATLIMNLWLEGNSPGNGKPTDIIIKEVDIPS